MITDWRERHNIKEKDRSRRERGQSGRHIEREKINGETKAKSSLVCPSPFPSLSVECRHTEKKEDKDGEIYTGEAEGAEKKIGDRHNGERL